MRNDMNIVFNQFIRLQWSKELFWITSKWLVKQTDNFNFLSCSINWVSTFSPIFAQHYLGTIYSICISSIGRPCHIEMNFEYWKRWIHIWMENELSFCNQFNYRAAGKIGYFISLGEILSIFNIQHNIQTTGQRK